MTGSTLEVNKINFFQSYLFYLSILHKTSVTVGTGRGLYSAVGITFPVQSESSVPLPGLSEESLNMEFINKHICMQYLPLHFAISYTVTEVVV